MSFYPRKRYLIIVQKTSAISRSSRMAPASSTPWLTTIYGFAPQTTAFSHPTCRVPPPSPPPPPACQCRANAVTAAPPPGHRRTTIISAAAVPPPRYRHHHALPTPRHHATAAATASVAPSGRPDVRSIFDDIKIDLRNMLSLAIYDFKDKIIARCDTSIN